ncbi:hypothetical protein GGD61_008323 [Bradyrhizobium sp. SBR1B]|nr:hypothetical protein [Bradyrhizobium sp. SBR1B]
MVATKVYGYESGKDTAKGFQPRPDVQNTAHALEQRARVIRQGSDWKWRLDPAVKHADPAFFVTPIAAGEKVVASKKAATAKLIKEHYGDAVAVEMEGSGFLKGGAYQSPHAGRRHPRHLGLVVRQGERRQGRVATARSRCRQRCRLRYPFRVGWR